jgi:WD40 repeat protein
MGQGRPRNVAVTSKGHTKLVKGVIFLPGGQWILTCSVDGSMRVWSQKRGQQMGSWRDGKYGVYAIALSPDRKKVVSGYEDGAVELWDIGTCKVIARWTGHAGKVSSVCWNQDGRRMVSGSDDGTARVWEGGKTILGPIETGLTNVKAVIYLADMATIATGGFNIQTKEFIKIWDADTGKHITNLIGHTSTAYCLTQTVDGKTLISGSFDGSVRTWNTATWTQIAVFTEYTGGSVYGVAVSPDDRILASALSDGTVRLWNLENGQPISSPLEHSDAVACVSFSADGKLLATACKDKNPYTWDVSAILGEAGLDDADLLSDSNVSKNTFSSGCPILSNMTDICINSAL